MTFESKLRSLTLAWYRHHGRTLPWRQTKDPYRIWVAEIMLQQTQVQRVIPFYQKFLRRFPNIRSLSRATWTELLPYWRGLGYYERGKNLLRAAQQVVSNHHGQLPLSKETLQSLPGIGPYTAAAILVFSGEAPLPAVDTNIGRVLERVYGRPRVSLQGNADLLFRQAKTKAAALNHALMDIGASVCGSRRTDCPHCPLHACCYFYRSGKQKLLGIHRQTTLRKTRQSATSVIDVGIACIHRNGRYLIGKRKAKDGGFWEFPGGKREGKESIRACLKREVKEELGIEVSVRPHFCLVEQKEHDSLWRFYFCRSQILQGREKKSHYEKIRWVSREELRLYTFPPANKKAILQLSRRTTKNSSSI